MLTVKIIPTTTPAGKLADAELHFSGTGRAFDPAAPPADDVLDGMKLVGFAVWERRGGGGRNVTFPARSYSVSGERRTFSLLRPVSDSAVQDRVRELVLAAYAEFEQTQQ